MRKYSADSTIPAPIGHTSRRNTGHEHTAASGVGVDLTAQLTGVFRAFRPAREPRRDAHADRQRDGDGNQHRQCEHRDVRFPREGQEAERQRSAALPERERRLDIAARQPAIEVVEQLDESRCTRTRPRGSRSARRTKHSMPAATPSATSAVAPAAVHNRTLQPLVEQARRLRGPPRDRARQVQLNAEIGNDRQHPSQRRSEREDTERLWRQASRRDDGDDEERAFAGQIGERFVRDQQRAARFRVWKRCFAHRKRFSLSQGIVS